MTFVRSGGVDISDGFTNVVGYHGYYWSRTSRSSTNAYNLNFDSSTVNPSNNNNRWGGRPLRWGLAGCGADLLLKIVPRMDN